MKIIAIIAALVAGSVDAAAAQVPRVYPVPAAGEVIRVTPDSGAAYTGRLTALGGDTVLLRPAGSDTVAMAVASRERVEVRRSRREAWSALGALAGVAAGLAASQLQSASGNEGLKRTQTAVVGGAAGGVIGGVLGFLVAPHRWQPLRTTLPRRTAPAELPPPPTASALDSAAASIPPVAQPAPAGSTPTPPTDTTSAPVAPTTPVPSPPPAPAPIPPPPPAPPPPPSRG